MAIVNSLAVDTHGEVLAQLIGCAAGDGQMGRQHSKNEVLNRGWAMESMKNKLESARSC